MRPRHSGNRKAGIENRRLIAAAKKHVGEFHLAKDGLSAGSVAAALVTKRGNIYTGICLDLACGVGFCAEHAAIASMLLNRETVIRKIVAVGRARILPPCGRCRELMVQVDSRNRECEVILPGGVSQKLKDLLPYNWLEKG